MAAESRFVSSCVKVREVAIILYEKPDMAGGIMQRLAQTGVRGSNTGKYTCTLSQHHIITAVGGAREKSEVLFTAGYIC